MTHLSCGDDRWCGHQWSSADDNDVDSVPDNADCDACLLAAFEYGLRAMRRRLFLRDGRILDQYQSIEKLLEYLATPVVYVRPAP